MTQKEARKILCKFLRNKKYNCEENIYEKINELYISIIKKPKADTAREAIEFFFKNTKFDANGCLYSNNEKYDRFLGHALRAGMPLELFVNAVESFDKENV